MSLREKKKEVDEALKQGYVVVVKAEHGDRIRAVRGKVKVITVKGGSR